MGASVGGKKGAMADINVTPLVDVVLVLLIIFMVVTPMLSSGVDVKLPKAKTADEERDMGQYLVVSVKKQGDEALVYVDKEETTLDGVAAAVEKVRANRPLIIKGDESVTYGQVRRVLDNIHATVAGTDTVLLAAEKIKEP